jgi:hypothetical protein
MWLLEENIVTWTHHPYNNFTNNSNTAIHFLVAASLNESNFQYVGYCEPGPRVCIGHPGSIPPLLGLGHQPKSWRDSSSIYPLGTSFSVGKANHSSSRATDLCGENVRRRRALNDSTENTVGL